MNTTAPNAPQTATDRLQLTRETLRALTSAELRLVAGGGRHRDSSNTPGDDADNVHIC